MKAGERCRHCDGVVGQEEDRLLRGNPTLLSRDGINGWMPEHTVSVAGDPGGRAQDGSRFHTIQTSVQFNIYELLTSGIFHLIFQTAVDHQLLKPQKVKPLDKGGLYYTLTHSSVLA